MNFPLFVAKRYLISRKSHNIINWISGISMSGIAIGTAALIIVLSVFNGLESAVISLFSVFDPNIRITASAGKTFHENQLDQKLIRAIPGVARYNQIVEENALLRYDNRQYLAVVKGVDSTYEINSPLDTLITEGQMLLQSDSADYAVAGYGLAYYLGISLKAPDNFISVYIPVRGRTLSASQPENAFNNLLVKPVGIFSVQQEFDDRYLLVPLRFARSLLEYSDELTAIEIRLAPGTNVNEIQRRIQQIAGKDFSVKNRFQQQEMLYKIMKTEKWAVFLVLAFILLVASFNAIGSLIMLIIDKQNDIRTLNALGAEMRSLRQIFFAEGMLITLLGALSGMLIGVVICWLQKHFGLVRLQDSGSFIFEYYPVQLVWGDFVVVGAAVLAIGSLASYIPLSRLRNILWSQRQ